MIESHWARIAGVHMEDNGTVGAIWLAHDTVTGVAHLYDAALFRTEVPVVIEDGISARGRQFPVAWAEKDKEFADALLNGGVNMLPDGCKDNQAMAELISRRVWQMLRGSRFRVDKRVGQWLREYKDFFRDEAAIPLKGFPLMAATRHAIEMIDWAVPESRYMSASASKQNAPKLAII